MKLKLGHYLSRDRALGFVLERTGDVVKVRYDGSSEVVELTTRPGPQGRTDCARGSAVVVQLFDDGRVVTFHPERPNGVEMFREEQLKAEQPGVEEKTVRKDQPLDVKLRVGHYQSKDKVIGFVLDRRGSVARLRLDGSTEVITLDPRSGPSGRTDFARQGSVMLNVWQDGRVMFYHPERPDGVWMRRDADADPL